jgi:hypothetical protein
MFGENIIDNLKMALEYILLGVFFLCAIEFIRIRDEYAQALNNQYSLQETTSQRLEFGKYNTGTTQSSLNECVTADMVIEAIRNYREGDISIYVDKTKNGTSLLLNESTAQTNKSRFTVEYLITAFDFNTYYHPYLVYDSQDVTTGSYTPYGTEVTGIAFLKYVP